MNHVRVVADIERRLVRLDDRPVLGVGVDPSHGLVAMQGGPDGEAAIPELIEFKIDGDLRGWPCLDGNPRCPRASGTDELVEHANQIARSGAVMATAEPQLCASRS